MFHPPPIPADKTHMDSLVGWTRPPNPNQAPPVPGGTDSPGEGVTTVSTEALKTYANNIDQLIPLVTRARDQLNLDWIQAGNFGAATLLKENMSGKDGFGDTTHAFLDQTANTLAVMRNTALAIAAEFENAEDLNEATSADLGFQMSDLKTAVGALHPAAQAEESGGSSGSGTADAA